MIGAGVPAGASSPNHDVASKPGTPASIMVGSSGMLGERCSAVMASPRSLPSRTLGRIAPAFWNVMVMRPPITSVKFAPRYGTCTMSRPSWLLNTSPAMCCGVPAPGLAIRELAGLRLGERDQFGDRSSPARRC